VLTAVLPALLSGCGTAAPDAHRPHSAKPPSASSPSPREETARATALARSRPARLRIPALHVDTAVMQLGLTARREVAVPPIGPHSPAGWYDRSPTPGEVGPSVILGHVTVGRYGDGVFKRLSALRAGNRVSITREDGSVAVFAVESVQTVPKSQFPTKRVYGNVDHPALRLITCGGTRISGSGGYPDNVIAYARLIAAP
jgi:sortase (surface protein transpeptidase)